MLTEKDYCDNKTSDELEKLGYPRYHYDATEVDKIFRIITLYAAQKWLREVKKLHITIYSQSQESWQYRITKPHQRLEEGLHGEDFNSFEEALSEGIKSAIKILKDGIGE